MQIREFLENKAIIGFLENKGYKHYTNYDNDSAYSSYFYQKRADLEYPDSPMCLTNDKLFFNIYYTYPNGAIISFHHETKFGWLKIEISLTEKQLRDDLDFFESKLISLWNLANLEK